MWMIQYMKWKMKKHGSCILALEVVLRYTVLYYCNITCSMRFQMKKPSISSKLQLYQGWCQWGHRGFRSPPRHLNFQHFPNLHIQMQCCIVIPVNLNWTCSQNALASLTVGTLTLLAPLAFLPLAPSLSSFLREQHTKIIDQIFYSAKYVVIDEETQYGRWLKRFRESFYCLYLLLLGN